MPLFLGLVPEDLRPRLLANLVADIEARDGHLNTGNQCTKYMIEALTENGAGDTAFGVVAQKTYPGWGFMLERGATTIWERWEELTGSGMNSHCHPMLGAVDAWFYKHLAGIRPDPAAPGWAHVIFRPYVVRDLTWAEASITTIRGRVRCRWERQRSDLLVDVEVPPGSRGTLEIPSPAETRATVREGDAVVWRGGALAPGVHGVRSGRREGDRVCIETGSGTYRFHASFDRR
jgi:alpha-L-rhamnosidase